MGWPNAAYIVVSFQQSRPFSVPWRTLEINAAHAKCKWKKFEYFFLAIVLNLGFSCIHFLFAYLLSFQFHPHKYYLFINNRHLSKLNRRRECKFSQVATLHRLQFLNCFTLWVSAGCMLFLFWRERTEVILVARFCRFW